MDCADDDEATLSLRRFYCSELSAQGARIMLDAAAAQHARVLRLAPGDTIELFDGRGCQCTARIEQLAKHILCCVPIGVLTRTNPGPEVVLVQCLPKGKKLDDIVRMTTELGVSAIHLAISERCVAQQSERDVHKVSRLARLACEAARQAEQPYIPEIKAPLPLSVVLAAAPAQASKIALSERCEGIARFEGVRAPLWLLTGPEGGLSAEDRATLRQAGFAEVGLGRAILRTETAAVVGVALGLSALGWRR